MTIVVEDGTGLADAESYQSVLGFQTASAAFGRDVTEFTDEQIEGALRRGTIYLDSKYKLLWRGRRLNGRAQALDWPRVNVYDNEGYLVDSTTLPKELVEACNEAVFRELTDPFSLTPDFVPAQEKIIEERVGPIMTRYSDKGPLDPIPRITVIEQLLSSLIGGSNIRQLVRY